MKKVVMVLFYSIDNERRNGDSMNENIQNQGQMPDFKNMSSSQFNTCFQGLSNNTDDNLFSLDMYYY